MSSAKRRRKDEEGSHGAKFLREQIAAILAFYKGVRGESCRDVCWGARPQQPRVLIRRYKRPLLARSQLPFVTHSAGEPSPPPNRYSLTVVVAGCAGVCGDHDCRGGWPCRCARCVCVRRAWRMACTVASTTSSATTGLCTRREPYNFTPMWVNSVSSARLHVRIRCTPMWALGTCRRADEIKTNTRSNWRDQVRRRHQARGRDVPLHRQLRLCHPPRPPVVRTTPACRAPHARAP